MSTKASIMYTKDHEHWYIDSSDNDIMTLVLSKENAKIVENDDFIIAIEVKPDTDIYNKLFILRDLPND